MTFTQLLALVQSSRLAVTAEPKANRAERPISLLSPKVSSMTSGSRSSAGPWTPLKTMRST